MSERLPAGVSVDASALEVEFEAVAADQVLEGAPEAPYDDLGVDEARPT